MSWARQACQSCSPFSLRGACADLDTYAGCTTAALQRTSSMASSPPEHVQPVDPPCATGMSARGIWSLATSTQQCSKKQLPTVLAGVQSPKPAGWEEERDSARGQKKPQTAENWSCQCSPTIPTTYHTCSKCGRSCRSRIGLFSHNRRCNHK